MKYDADAIKGYASIYWNGTKDERIAGMMLHDYAALIKEAHEIFTAKGSYDCKVDPRIEVEYQRAYGLLQKLSEMMPEPRVIEGRVSRPSIANAALHEGEKK